MVGSYCCCLNGLGLGCRGNDDENGWSGEGSEVGRTDDAEVEAFGNGAAPEEQNQ